MTFIKKKVDFIETAMFLFVTHAINVPLTNLHAFHSGTDARMKN